MRDALKWAAAVLLAGTVLVVVFLFTSNFIQAVFHYQSKPAIQLVDPKPVCKICHCHKTFCHRECGEENMCILKCEGLCQKRGNNVGH